MRSSVSVLDKWSEEGEGSEDNTDEAIIAEMSVMLSTEEADDADWVAGVDAEVNNDMVGPGRVAF